MFTRFQGVKPLAESFSPFGASLEFDARNFIIVVARAHPPLLPSIEILPHDFIVAGAT